MQSFIQDNEIMEKIIDLEKILYSKMGSKARFLPLKWFEKFVHLDEINEFLRENQGKQGIDFTEAALKRMKIKLELEGTENLPASDDGKYYTFVSNHVLGAIDGIALLDILGRRYGGASHVAVVSNDILKVLSGLEPFIIGINKSGSQDRNLPQQINAAFSGDRHVMLFPAGIVARKKKGVLHDLKWNKMFVTKSVQFQRDVVPIHFIGENSPFYYRVTRYFDWFLTRPGIGRLMNFLFMPGELVKSEGKTYRIIFGKPIPWQTFDKSKTHLEWADEVCEIVHQL